MTYSQPFSRTVFLASLCLAACVGDSTHAMLLRTEHLDAFAQRGHAADRFLLPWFLVQDNIDSWNSAGSIPGIEFHLLDSPTANDLPQVKNVSLEVSKSSELRFSAPPFGNEKVGVKSTHLAAQILAKQISDGKFKGVRRDAPNFRQVRRSASKKPKSWVALAEILAYVAGALLALGAVGMTVFKWNLRRLERLEIERFSNIPESDLMMARMSQLPPADWWSEFQRDEESSTLTNTGGSHMN